jgi:hypothetical protein
LVWPLVPHVPDGSALSIMHLVLDQVAVAQYTLPTPTYTTASHQKTHRS